MKSHIERIPPYQPGKSIEEISSLYNVSNPIKLASNENPYGCPLNEQDLKTIIAKAAQYPDIHHHPLPKMLAERHHVGTDQLIFGNGSDEILQFIGLVYLDEEDEVIVSDITFSIYSFVTQIMNAKFTVVPLGKTYCVDLQAIQAAITEKTKVIFIANPNNPTGTLLTHQELTAFLDRVPPHVIVVLDEAYIDFTEHPNKPDSIALVHAYPNVVVTRTFSKSYGLAGFRIGYGISNKKIIGELQRVRPPFNVNSLALEAARLALGHHDFFTRTLTNNQVEKERLTHYCTSLGLTVLPSYANFICILLEKNTQNIVEYLLKKGMIVRHLKSFGLPEAIRVTIGTPEQNAVFMQQFTEALDATKHLD